jgi:hypothetical protein
LFDGNNQPIRSNDNWRGVQATEIIARGFAPGDEREAALIETLPPGNYTAIVSGVGRTTGVALVEVYDLDPEADSQLGNISTRGKVLRDDEVMIGGFILRGPSASTRVAVRALGPTLTQFAVPGALQDTTLDLRDANGVRMAFNDEWRSHQAAEIIQARLDLPDNREAILIADLPAGSYTAIVRGKDDMTGVALVEAFVLQ